MAPRSIVLLALGALAVQADMLLPRAGNDVGLDDAIWSVCSRDVASKTKLYEGCYSSAFMSMANCKGSLEACGCTMASALIKTCLPIVCPTALASSLLSAGCEALIGKATATATGGGVVKSTSAAGKTAATASGSGSGPAKTGSVGSVFSTASPTGSAATTGGSSGSGSGGSSAGSNGNNNGNGNSAGSPQTTSSRALAGDVVVPVVGGAIAGIIGALAVLL